MSYEPSVTQSLARGGSAESRIENGTVQPGVLVAGWTGRREGKEGHDGGETGLVLRGREERRKGNEA